VPSPTDLKVADGSGDWPRDHRLRHRRCRGGRKLRQAVDEAVLKAEKHAAMELGVSPKDVDKAVQEAPREVS
jgi:hypothetical protein